MGMLGPRPCCPHRPARRRHHPRDAEARTGRRCCGSMARASPSGNATFETEAPARRAARTHVAAQPPLGRRARRPGHWLDRPRSCVRGVWSTRGWPSPRSTSPRACAVAGSARRWIHKQVTAADDAGLWTLQTAIFPENRASDRAAPVRRLSAPSALRERIGLPPRRLARHRLPRAPHRHQPRLAPAWEPARTTTHRQQPTCGRRSLTPADVPPRDDRHFEVPTSSPRRVQLPRRMNAYRARRARLGSPAGPAQPTRRHHRRWRLIARDPGSKDPDRQAGWERGRRRWWEEPSGAPVSKKIGLHAAKPRKPEPGRPCVPTRAGPPASGLWSAARSIGSVSTSRWECSTRLLRRPGEPPMRRAWVFRTRRLLRWA